jgi:hypothetical protein
VVPNVCRVAKLAASAGAVDVKLEVRLIAFLDK